MTYMVPAFANSNLKLEGKIESKEQSKEVGDKMILEEKENAAISLSRALDAAEQTRAEAADNAAKLQAAIELQAKQHSTALDEAQRDAATSAELAQKRAGQLQTAESTSEELCERNTELESQLATVHAQLQHRANEHTLALRNCEASAMRCAELETLVVSVRQSGIAALEDARDASQVAQEGAVLAVKLELERAATQSAREQEAQHTHALEQARAESEAACRAAEGAHGGSA